MRRATRWMRLLLLAGLALCAATVSAEEPTHVTLAGIERVGGTRLLDLDGDGRAELAVLDGRTLRVFAAPPGGLPAKAANWSIELPEDVLFVDLIEAAREGVGRLVLIGREGTRIVPVRGEDASLAVADALAPDWSDPQGPTLAPLVGPRWLLLPTRDGLGLFEPQEGRLLQRYPVSIDRHVEAPGPFVEDQSVITTARPTLLIASHPRADMPGDAPAAWALMDGRLVAMGEGGGASYDLAFLPSAGERRVIDLDGNGLPDVLHIETTNRTGRYGFFRTRAVAAGAKVGPAHRPANSVLSLTGFQLEPQFADLEGDGDLDFILTTIAVDGANTVRAVTQRKVTAVTQAFLNRGGESRWFQAKPDAMVNSDVGVRIRFTYEGSLEVERTVTILADGDYDGDGLKDLLIRTAPDTFTWRRGSPDNVWEAAGREIAVPPAGPEIDLTGEAVDLDGDGRDELLLTYSARDHSGDRLVVVRPGR